MSDERDDERDNGFPLNEVTDLADLPGDDDLPPGVAEPEAPLAEASFAEALRADPALADIALSLILMAFPRHRVMRGAEGRLAALYLDPPLDASQSRRLLEQLYQLVERPEWRARHAVAREVSDVRGTRIELLMPLAPDEYDGGEALVGPFADDEAARNWASGIAEPGLAFDTVPVTGAYLVDLFMLGELLDD